MRKYRRGAGRRFRRDTCQPTRQQRQQAPNSNLNAEDQLAVADAAAAGRGRGPTGAPSRAGQARRRPDAGGRRGKIERRNYSVRPAAPVRWDRSNIKLAMVFDLATSRLKTSTSAAIAGRLGAIPGDGHRLEIWWPTYEPQRHLSHPDQQTIDLSAPGGHGSWDDARRAGKPNHKPFAERLR
jgi:hypothetical protein